MARAYVLIIFTFLFEIRRGNKYRSYNSIPNAWHQNVNYCHAHINVLLISVTCLGNITIAVNNTVPSIPPNTTIVLNNTAPSNPPNAGNSI